MHPKEVPVGVLLVIALLLVPPMPVTGAQQTTFSQDQGVSGAFGAVEPLLEQEGVTEALLQGVPAPSLDWEGEGTGYVEEHTCYTDNIDIGDAQCPEGYACDDSGVYQVGNGAWYQDHYCHDGRWTTRTALVAEQLHRIANEANSEAFTITCGPFQEVLNDYDYDVDYYLDGSPTNQLSVSDIIEGEISLAANALGLPEGSYHEVCDPAGDLAIQDKGCANHFCVLTYQDLEDEPLVGTSINNVHDPNVADHYNFFAIFGKDDTFRDACMAKDDLASCGGNIYFDKQTNITVFSKSSIGGGDSRAAGELLVDIVSNIINAFTDRIVGWLGIDDSIVINEFVTTRNTQRLYYSQNGNRAVFGVIDRVGDTEKRDVLGMNFHGFESDVCDTIAASQQPLGAFNARRNNIGCDTLGVSNINSIFRYFVNMTLTAESDGSIKQDLLRFWQNLTHPIHLAEAALNTGTIPLPDERKSWDSIVMEEATITHGDQTISMNEQLNIPIGASITITIEDITGEPVNLLILQHVSGQGFLIDSYPYTASKTIDAFQGAPLEGSYAFWIAANNSQGENSFPYGPFYVDASNTDPVVQSATATPAEGVLGDSITLSGDATDEETTDLTYLWETILTPEGTEAAAVNLLIADQGAAETTVEPPSEGTYQFRLTVTDEHEGSHALPTQTVTIYEAPTLGCALVDGECGADYTPLFAMHEEANTHAATDRSETYPQTVCCQVIKSSFDSRTHTLTKETEQTDTNAFVIALAEDNNAHASVTEADDYTPIYLEYNHGLLGCRLETAGDCSEGETCLYSIAAEHNAHVAACMGEGAYTNKVCCGLATTPALPLTS